MPMPAPGARPLPGAVPPCCLAMADDGEGDARRVSLPPADAQMPALADDQGQPFQHPLHDSHAGKVTLE